MMRYLKALLFSVLVIGLMAGSAFGGVLSTVPKTQAVEMMAAAAVIVPAVESPISYRPEIDLIAGDTFTLKATNGKFNFTVGAQDQIFVCTGAVVVAQSPVLAASTDTTVMTVQAGQSLGATTLVAIQGGLTATPCAAGLLPQPNIEINAGTAANTNVTVEVSASSKAGATAAAQNVYNVVNQFTTTLTPVTSKLDFATGMKSFVVAGGATFPSTTAAKSRAALLIVSNESIPVGNKIVLAGGTAAGCDWNLGANGAFTAKVTGDLTGLIGFEYFAGVPTVAIAAADVTAGVKNLPITGAQIKVCKSADIVGASTNTPTDINLVNANPAAVAMNTGTRTLQLDAAIAGTWAQAKNLVAAGTTGYTFALDATQYYIPLVGSVPASGRETYIKLQSKSSVAGANGVSVAILASDGSITTTYAPGNITIGVPMLITGEQLVAAATAAGTPVDGALGFAVIVTVNAPEADVFAYANMIDASGAKRLPVKGVGGIIKE